MLDVKKDRIDYSGILIPPEGFYLAKAIATTYTLDLFTLLSIPVALFFGREPAELVEKGDSIEILDAIQKMNGIVDVFCQKGKIKIPDEFNQLFAFLEESVHEIPLDSEYSSFHPKVWILRYAPKESEKDVVYRLIVLSRNLTFDRSWDIAFYTEGSVGRKGKHNKELIDFLDFLAKKSDFQLDEQFKKELQKVEFEDFDSSKMQFYPIFSGDNIKKYSNPLSEINGDKLLIMSPFVDSKTLKNFANQADKKFLFSRKLELDKIEASVLKLFDEIFYLNPNIVNGEDMIEEDEAQAQNLHAKLFVVENGKENQLFLGSANCTSPTFGRNTEFLVRLINRKKEFGVEFLKKEFANEGDGYFLKYDIDKVERNKVEEVDDLRKLEFQLQKAFLRGKVSTNEQNRYDICVFYDLSKCYLDSEYQFFIRPLGLVDEKPMPPDNMKLVFSNLELKNLSSFFVIVVRKNDDVVLSTMQKVPIEMPEGRIDSVFKALVNSKDAFEKYLTFLLGQELENGEASVEGYLTKNSANGKEKHLPFFGKPIFEQLLKAASSDKQKLKSIAKLLERLKSPDGGPGVVSEDFIELWDVFKGFIKE